MSINRRQMMIGTASTALYGAPWPAFALDAESKSPKLAPVSDLCARVNKIVANSRDAADDLFLLGTYACIFEKRPSTQRIEQTVHVSYARSEDVGQRFIFTSEMEEVGWSFDVVHDDDPRHAIENGRTVRIRDLPKALDDLYGAAHQAREEAAMRVFDTAGTYNACVGGDGVSLCSENHPHDKGVWRNTFKTQLDLNASSLKQALRDIRDGYKDDGGTRIFACGQRLLVGEACADSVEESLRALDRRAFPTMSGDHLVLEHLKNPNYWFVQTNIPGLVWYEREPFTVTAWTDEEHGCVHVVGRERRKFDCVDPRALFGSLPNA